MWVSTLSPPTDAMLRTTPPRSAMDARQADWIHTSGPRQFTATVLSNRLVSMPSVGPMYGLVAALFTRMSTDPRRSTVAATQASAWSGSPALAANDLEPWRPASTARISAAHASRASTLRDESITAAPLAASVAAIALPMPRDAPVTSATFPSTRMSIDEHD